LPQRLAECLSLRFHTSQASSSLAAQPKHPTALLLSEEPKHPLLQTAEDGLHACPTLPGHDSFY